MQNFENPPEQRMSDAEAQAVLRILAERQRKTDELHAMPSVQDVAAVANAPKEEVLSALLELRAAQMAPRVMPRPRNPLLPIVMAVCGVMFFVALLSFGYLLLRTNIAPTRSIEAAPVAGQPAPISADVMPPPEMARNVAPSPN
ncbi:MAG TPA: hypothetical protein VK934_03540 [Fimbriimonas sp.]|nr:hypothetical protein [Fimbriimonas sp.]